MLMDLSFVALFPGVAWDICNNATIATTKKKTFIDMGNDLTT
jgi:hypothetical protein